MKTDAGGASSTWAPTGPLLREPRSILVIMLSAVGDAVMVLPVLHALRRSFPDAHITWAVQPGPAPLARGFSAVDEVVQVHRRRGATPGALARSAGGLWRASRKLRTVAREHSNGSFDLLLDLQTYFKAGVLTGLTPARIKLGFDRRRTRDLNGLFTTHRIPPNPWGYAHVQEQYFEFLRYVGVRPEPVDYGLRILPDEREEQRVFFQELPAPACSLVLATTRSAKNWTPEGYATVAQALASDLGLQPILVGGRSPVENEMARAIRNLAPGSAVDARARDLRRLLWLLDGSSLAISPDTGPLHMARALEVPVVGLFGATNPRRSGPYRMFTELVVDGYSRPGGEETGAEPGLRPEGMRKVTPERVLERVEEGLERYGVRA